MHGDWSIELYECITYIKTDSGEYQNVITMIILHNLII